MRLLSVSTHSLLYRKTRHSLAITRITDSQSSSIEGHKMSKSVCCPLTPFYPNHPFRNLPLPPLILPLNMSVPEAFSEPEHLT